MHKRMASTRFFAANVMTFAGDCRLSKALKMLSSLNLQFIVY